MASDFNIARLVLSVYQQKDRLQLSDPRSAPTTWAISQLWTPGLSFFCTLAVLVSISIICLLQSASPRAHYLQSAPPWEPLLFSKVQLLFQHFADSPIL